MKRLFSKETDQYIYSRYKSTPYAVLAEELGVTERQLRGHINNMGWTKKEKKDTSYFGDIDSPEKAYWIGLLYADGYLRYDTLRGTYEAAIELQDCDLPTIERLNENFCNQFKITHLSKDTKFNGYSYHTESNVLRIYSKEVCEDLMRHGIFPNKTGRKEFPIMENFLAAFIRGFLDGDGCIYISKSNNVIITFTNANLLFLEYINEMIANELQISGHIYKEKERKYKLWYMRQEDVKLLLDWIYLSDDAWRMERKYQKYKSHYGLAA